MPDPQAIVVYVLYVDVVDSTRATVDEQHRVNTRLQDLVKATSAFQDELAANELISLPSGDGLALVFLRRMDGALRCAVEIAQVLKADPFCKLRSGIHAGAVIVEDDITGKRNVSGDGINLAARVMSSGTGGDILLTQNAADLIRNLTLWKDKLHYAGERQVKKDRINTWSYWDGEVGNPPPPRSPHSPARRTWLWLLAALILIAGMASLFLFRGRTPEQQAAAPPPPASASVDMRMGMNLWRMLPSPPQATYKKRGLRYKGERPGHDRWTPERVTLDHQMAEGDNIRISVQPYQAGYLYVIDRDVFANGQRGLPVLIFPTLEIRRGINRIEKGQSVGIPPMSDTPPTFTVERTRPDQSGILITLIFSPEPLPGIQVQSQAQTLSEAVVAKWEKDWGSQVQLSENAGLDGTLYTAQEEAAEQATAPSAPGQPITLFTRNAKPGEPIVASAMIKVAAPRK